MMNLHKIIYIKHSAINQHLKPFSRLRHILGTANIYFTTPKKKRRIQRNSAAISIKNLYEHLNHFLNPFLKFFFILIYFTPQHKKEVLTHGIETLLPKLTSEGKK